MKQLFILIFSISVLSATAQAQNFRSYLPEGYNILKAWQDKELYLEADFNEDSQIDYFVVLEKEDKIGFLTLMSEKGKLQIQKTPYITLDNGDFYCCSTIELLPKNVIKLSSLGNRYFEHYKFRWDDKKGEFRVIGYDSEGLPDNYGDSYSMSFNFYTRQLISTTNHNNFETGASNSKSESKYIKGLGKFYLKDFRHCIQQVQGFISE